MVSSDWDGLRRTALKFARLWCRSTADVEDVAHEALTALLRETNPVNDPAAWLFIVVKRTALRANSRERRVSLSGCRSSATRIDDAETALLYIWDYIDSDFSPRCHRRGWPCVGQTSHSGGCAYSGVRGCN